MKLLVTILILTLLSCQKEIQLPEPKTKVSKNCIFLDFDGQYVTSRDWAYRGEFLCANASLPKDSINKIVDSVKFKYKGFDVTVTTDSTDYFKTDSLRRTRCIITTSYYWTDGTTAGLAKRGSFVWGTDTPCFVFSSQLNYSLKRISETIAHEVGHTLGLAHQALWVNGVKRSDYLTFFGQDAPIMGNSQFGNGVWWKGTDANGIYQDDEQIIKETLK